MLTIKSVCIMWFLLKIIPAIYSSEYLHFGGNEEESRQAEYYLSADSGTNIGPTDDLIRTQRSFWNLFRDGLFGKCGNCCNSCNYNVGNGNWGPPLLLPFQPLRPFPLWRPLQPLFGRLNHDNYGTSSFARDNLNGCGNLPIYGVNKYSYTGINSPSNYDNNVAAAPEPVYEIAKEFPPVESDYQADNGPVTEDSYEPSLKTEMSTYTNEKPLQYLQESNKKVPQIRYQPIIYVSPQGNKALNQGKEDETKYSEYSRENEIPQIPNYETVSDEEFKQSLYNSNLDKTKSEDNVNAGPNPPQKQILAVANPCSETIPYTETPAQSTNPSLSTVSAVYNIITPSLLHSITTTGNPYPTSVITSNVPSSNFISSDNYPLTAPAITTLPFPHRPTYPTWPIQLTLDDQPYRVCPELFEEYQRKVNTYLRHTHGSSIDSSCKDSQLVQY